MASDYLDKGDDSLVIVEKINQLGASNLKESFEPSAYTDQASPLKGSPFASA